MKAAKQWLIPFVCSLLVGMAGAAPVLADNATTLATEPPLRIEVIPATTVAHSEDVSLTAKVSNHADVKSYRWAHIGGSQNMGTAQTLTIDGSGWPTSPGTRTFEVTVTFNDGTQLTASQAISFTKPTNPPLAPGATLSISVSPATTVAHSEDVSLTANVSNHADKVKSYRWAHVGGDQNMGTAQTLTIDGSGWPTSPGTRTFEVTVTFTDGSQLTASQAISFTKPSPPPGAALSIAVSPSASMAHAEEVTLTANVSSHADQVQSYRWAHIGGSQNMGTAQTLTLGGSGWPTGPGTRTFEVTVTFTNGSQLTASRAIAFTNEPEDATLARIRQEFVGDAATVEDFVLALPGHHKSRSLFMLESQAGDADFVSSSTPRAISWGATADDLFSWGTNDQSPHYDEVEFITKEYGEWVFGVIDFTASPPALSEKTDECHACHVNGHPIWGVNYGWPGTLFDSVSNDLLGKSDLEWIQDLKSSGDPRVTQVSTEPGYGVTLMEKPLEMEEAVVTRHAEVLVESVMPEGDATDYAAGLLCPYGRDTTLREDHKKALDMAMEALFPVVHWPHAMRDGDGDVRDVAGYRPLAVHNAFFDSNAHLYSTMAFYLIRYLVDHDDAVEKLYADLANEETVFATSSYYQQFLHYPAATATAVDELDSRSDIFFDLKGVANLNYRMDLMSTMSRRHQVVLRSGHLQAMVPKVCGVLYPEE